MRTVQNSVLKKSEELKLPNTDPLGKKEEGAIAVPVKTGARPRRAETSSESHPERVRLESGFEKRGQA